MTAQTHRSEIARRARSAERAVVGKWARGCGRQAQGGAIAILFAIVIVVLIGFCGLALDLSRFFNRKTELQAVADAAALAAARELDGTSAGITRAQDRAAAAANALKYGYNQNRIVWSAEALKFSTSSSAVDSDWVAASAASVSPADLVFAKVDTAALGDAGEVSTAFMRAVSSSFNTATITGRAVAGPTTINVTPLAICALSNTRAVKRINPGPPSNEELVEFGFRRGVAYDLMQLNPETTTPARHFMVDPVAPAGASGSATNFNQDFIAPFVCAGRMRGRRLGGSTVAVTSDFPIKTFFRHLNTRFAQYTGTSCSPLTAPPDTNVKPYDFTNIPWMTSTGGTGPGQQTALSTTSGGKLWTIADPLPAPATNTAPMYGPLWSFAKAIPWSSYTSQGPVEPAAGYTAFAPAAWSTLYKPGPPSPNSYPSPSPYMASGTTYSSAPATAYRPGKLYRRVLNVPLLQCPVPMGGPSIANVLAIGRFFMTVPATEQVLSAEFAGLAREESLSGEVELIQ